MSRRLRAAWVRALRAAFLYSRQDRCLTRPVLRVALLSAIGATR